MSTQARPSTHHKTSRRPGLLSLNEAGISVRSGAGGSSSAALPSSGLPPRPSTRGDAGAPLRRPGPLGFTGATGAAVPSGLGGSPQLPRVSTPARASGGRPPVWGHAQSAPTTPLQPQPRAATANAPVGGGASRPTTQQRGRRSASQSVEASAASSGSAASAATAAAALKRPSSQQTTRPGTRGRTGAMGGQDFHRGLVSALQDVLRQQRQGVFPTVTTDGIEMSRAAGSRPGTSAGAERGETPSQLPGSRGAPATPLGGAGGRWGFTPTQDESEDPFPPRPTNADPSAAGPSRGGRRAAPWVDEAEDVLLSAAALQMLRNVERSEAMERRNLLAQADSDRDAIMAQETAAIVRAAHKPTSAASSAFAAPGSRASSRPSSSTAPGNATRGSSAASLRRKMSGAQLRAKRHGATASHDTSTESATGGGTATPSTDASFSEGATAGVGHSGGDAASLKAQGNAHYAQRRFLEAHRSYSQAMELDAANGVLLANRAAVHTMLLNYDACVRDCLRATSIDPKNWKAYSRMGRAYAMLGQYPVAARHYTTALLLVEDALANNASPAANAASAEGIKAERGELQHLERARLETEASNPQAAAGLYTKAASFVDEPPIRLLRLGCVLQFSPTTARAELTKYLSTLEHPSTYAVADAAGAKDTHDTMPVPPSSLMPMVPKLLSAKAMHYCAVLVTLAKASLFCGVHYLNIAASHLNQCLAIKADYPGAQAMLVQLTTFEDRLAAATELADAESHADAVTAFTEALDATHDANAKVRGLVLVQRAESYLQVSMPKPALEDCSIALGYDGNNVKALTKRARAHEALGDFRAALGDLEHAATINEEIADAVVALRLRMQQHQREQQQQQQQQRQQSGGGYFGGSRPGTGHGYGARPGTGSSSWGQRPGTSQQDSRPVTTHYETLGVRTDADSAAIRAAYRKLTLQVHPDKVVKESEEVRRRCEVRFKEVAHAYSVLSDPVQRMQYDLTVPTA